MTGQRKAVLGFREQQTGQANRKEETNGVGFLCRFLWCHLWGESVSSIRKIYIINLSYTLNFHDVICQLCLKAENNHICYILPL